MAATPTPPLPSPPFYTIPNINNLRDPALTLNLTTPTGKIRPGILFRSADVSRLDAEGWKAVHDIGVGHVFDLRSKPELLKAWKGIAGKKEGEGGSASQEDVRLVWEEGMRRAGVGRLWCPVFEDSDYSPERLAGRYMKYMDESTEGFVHAYRDILTHAGTAFCTILQYLINLPSPGDEKSQEKGLGALIHCTAGKDRTGIFFGVLFSFLGVDKERIADDYNLTELGLAHIREEVLERLMQSPGLKMYMSTKMTGNPISTQDAVAALSRAETEGGAPGGEEQAIPLEFLEIGRQAGLRMIGARRECMLGALEMVEREWGGSEGYFRKVCGLNDGELETLRRNLVV